MVGDRVHPSRDDALVRSLSEVAGGPLGDHAGRHPWWTPLRVVLLLAAVALSLGMVAKAPCLDVAGEGGTGRYAALCWSDVSQAYVDRGHAELAWPFTDDAGVRDRYAPGWQPPVPAYVAWAAARVTHVLAGSPDLDERRAMSVADVAADDAVHREARIFTAVTAVWLAAAGLLAAGLLVGVRRRRPWDAAAFAAAPVLVLLWPITWDLLAAAAVAAVLWGWARGRPGVAGAALGVGAAVSPLVALLLVPLLAVGVRDRRSAQAWRVAAVAAVTWLVVDLPAYVSSPAAWEASWQGYLHGVDVGSVWLLVQQAGNVAPSRTTVVVVSGLLVAAWLLVVAVVGLRTRLSLAALGTLAVAGTLVVSPAAAPSYALVLLPLAALGVPRWRDLLVWQAGELAHFALLGWYLGGLLAPAGGGDARAYWWGMVARLLGLAWLVAAVLIRAGSADGSADDDVVEVGRGEADPDVDVLADGRHARA
ncbi:hypothetical protein ASG94_09965 [Nocardioides sp. Soil805]|nr:hypothetical protein ASG94_09965 [Nocardioides sp. Soil805]